MKLQTDNSAAEEEQQQLQAEANVCASEFEWLQQQPKYFQADLCLCLTVKTKWIQQLCDAASTVRGTAASKRRKQRQRLELDEIRYVPCVLCIVCVLDCVYCV